MADNQNNVTTVFSADISNFSNGAQELSRYVSTVNAEFKNAVAGTGDWSKSTDGLQAKIKQLNGQLAAQKKQLESTRSAYEELVRQGKGNTAEAQKLYIKLQQQEAQVKETEAGIEKYTQSLNDLDKTTEKTEKSTSEFGASLGDLAKGAIAGITAAAAGAITAFFGLAESTRETRTQIGQLETAFTTAGLSAEQATGTYTELYGVLGDTGKANEASLQLAQLASSEEELAGLTHTLTGVYATFGDSLPVEALAEAINHTAEVGAVQGNLADALEWSGVSVDDFNASLALCNSEQERQELITTTLNGLYGEAADKYKEVNADIIAANTAQMNLNTALAELGAIAEPIMTTLKNLAADLLRSITPFVELIGSGLTGALNGSATAADDLAAGIGGILNVLVEKLTAILPTVLNMILQLIPTVVSSLLGALPQLLDTVISLVNSIIVLIAELLPDIVAKVVEIIPILIKSIVSAIPKLLQAAIKLLMAIVQAIPTIIKGLLAELPKIIETIVNTVLQALPMLTDAAVKLLMSIVQAIPTIITALVGALPSIINTIINGLLTALPMLIDASIKLLMSIVQAIPTIVNALIGALPTIINTILSAVTKALPQLLQAAVTLLLAIVQAIPKILPQLISILPSIITTITRVLIQNIPLIINASIQLFMGLIKAIPTIIGELIRQLPTIITSIVSGLGKGVKDLVKVGGDLLGGLIKGLINPDNIGKAIKKMGNSITTGFKNFFNIKSPSHLMEDMVGKNIGLGVGEGIIDSIPTVNKQIGKFNDVLRDNMSGSVSINGAGSAAGGTTNNTRNVNVYQTFEKIPSTRYALRQARIETVNAVKFAGGV